MRKLAIKVVPKIAVFALALFITGFSLVPAGECSQEQAGQPVECCDSNTVTHIVQEGDTLYAIAQKHSIELRHLMRANNLTGSLIRPGDILVIPENSAPKQNLSRGEISREDLLLLARIIHAEARGESFEGQVAVGAVILNRLASPYFPKTMREVIYQKTYKTYQFSPVADGTINLEPDAKAIEAATQAISGADPTGGALFFYNPDIASDQWIRTLPVVLKIGNHVFASSH